MKVLGGETNLNAPISVGSARVVRVFNSDSSNLLVTRKTSGGTTIGTFLVPAGKVVYCEKDYTDTLEGGENLKVTHVAFSPMMSFALMSSADPVPSYTHSVSSTSVDEGGNFTTTISTTNVDDGTNLYWELTGVQSSDFSSGALTGTATISSNSATFSHTVDEDLTTEGTETATIKVYSDSGRTEQVGNTLTVTIADTSTTPPSTPASVSFDGSNDYLYVGGNAARHAMADFGTGAYTIECWLKTTKANQWIFYNADNHTGVRICFGNNGGGGNDGQIEINEQSNNGDQQTRTPGTYNDGNWHHVAFCRPDGGKVKIFVDGSEKAEGQDSGRNLSATAVTAFLTGRRGSGGNHFEGNIYGIRVIKGQAIYTSNFSVPTSAPTTTSQGADASKVTLLCATTDDVDASVVSPEAGNTLQAFGVTSSADTPFISQYGTFFNGGTKRLYIEPTSDFSFGTDDFTIEAYVQRTSDNYAYSRILHFGTYWNADSAVGLAFDDGDHQNKITFSSHYNRSQGSVPGNGRVLVGTTTVVNNQWYHVAATRKNGVFRLFVDGNLEATNSTITGRDLEVDYNGNGQPLAIANTFDRHVQEPIVAKISNVRITKGQCLYETDFQPSTIGLSLTSQGATASNVKFLGVNKDNPTDSTVTPGTIYAYGVNSGDTNKEAYSPFTGNWSIDFEGSPDYLSIEHSTDFDMASSDFTMECWYYPRSNPSWVGLISQWPNGGYNTTNSWTLEPVGNGLYFYYCKTNGSYSNIGAPGSIQTNQWQHCAISKKNNQLKIFLNGSGSSWTTIDGTMQNSTEPLTIGGYVAPSQGSGWANGLISNVRITKGECVYENNFTPPTAPLTTTSQDVTSSNVKLLCCNKSILLYADVTPNDIDIGDGSPIPTDTNPF